MKYWVYILFWFPAYVESQLLPANRYYNSNQTNSLIWDNTASNGAVNNGNGTWNVSNLTWLRTPTGVNQSWVNGYDATFGGNPGTGAAGTITISGTHNVKKLFFETTPSGTFTLQNGVLQLQGGLFINQQNAAISSTLQGSGNYTKRGSGNLILSGNNTISGSLIISQGGMYLGSSTGIGTTSVVIGDASTGAANTEWRWAGGVAPSNNIEVTALGTGTVTIGAYSAGLNTRHTGNITIGKDIIFYDASNDRSSFEGIISGSASLITINGNGTYNVNTGQGARITFDNNSNTFNADMLVMAGKAFQFNATNAVNGNAIECNGDIVINSSVTTIPVMGSLSGSGRVSIHPATSADATFSIGNDNGNGVFSGIISDGGGDLSITKVGTGTQLLNGTCTYSGSTTINNGVLGGTGNLSNSSVTIINSNGKIMGGTGTGNAGIFTVDDLEFANNSTAAINVYSNGTNLSRIQVNGTCKLGTTSKVNLMQTMPAGTYNIISSTDTMNGTTPTVGINLSGRTASVSRPGRNLRVTLT